MRPALLLIDVQANMFDPAHSVESASPLLQRITGLLAKARGEGAPIVFVRNCGNSGDPDARGTSGWELQPPLRTEVGEIILDKTTCDTFASTHLQEELAARDRELTLRHEESERRLAQLNNRERTVSGVHEPHYIDISRHMERYCA